MTRAGRLALLVTWGGAAAGLTEVLLHAVQKWALHRFVRHGAAIVWMAPLADVLVLAVVAVLLGAVSLAWPRAAGTRVAATALGFVAAFGVLLMQPWLHWWAVAILAAGIALQAGRVGAAREAAVLRLLARTAPVLVGLVVVLAAAVHVPLWMAERRALAALPPAPADAPNVLFLIWDTVRSPSLSRYGYARRTTPRLDSLAAHGVTFDRAVAPASYTLASHASFFTGRWPHELTASWVVPLDDSTPTLAEALAARGWRTGGFSANWIFVTREFGLARGFARFEDTPVNLGELLRSSALLEWLFGMDGLRPWIGWYDVLGRKRAPELADRLLRWVDADTTRPFFAFVNMFDAHEPYLPRAPFDTLFGWPAGGGRAERRAVRAEALLDKVALPADRVGRQRDAYDGAIAEQDHDTGELLAALVRRGRLANTLVIIASDHGEEFGEQDSIFGHGNSVFWPSLHVPLVVLMPGRVPGGLRVTAVASLRDLPATIGDLVGARDWPLPGASLARFWRAPSDSLREESALAEIDHLANAGGDWYPVTHADLRSLVRGRHHVIATGDSLALFDLDADPWEQTDLARTEPGRALARALADTLRVMRATAVPGKR